MTRIIQTAWNLKRIGEDMTGKKGMKMPQRTDEWREYKSKSMKGNQHHKGFKHTEEAKMKVSMANKGKISCWKGKHLSKEHIFKRSQSRIGTPAWNKGIILVGKEISSIRHTAKRRCLGKDTLNSYIKDYEGHHIDREHIVFIPRWLHRSIWHCQSKPNTMEKININICYWLMILRWYGNV